MNSNSKIQYVFNEFFSRNKVDLLSKESTNFINIELPKKMATTKREFEIKEFNSWVYFNK